MSDEPWELQEDPNDKSTKVEEEIPQPQPKTPPTPSKVEKIAASIIGILILIYLISMFTGHASGCSPRSGSYRTLTR